MELRRRSGRPGAGVDPHLTLSLVLTTFLLVLIERARERRSLMNIDLIFKIAGIGIIVSILFTVLKQAGKDEFSYILSLAGVVIVLMMVIQLVNSLFDTVRSVFKM